MPLVFAGINENLIIQDVKGKEEQKRFLSSLGFVKGAKIKVVAKNDQNLIVNVKDARIAIGKEIAIKIVV